MKELILWPGSLRNTQELQLAGPTEVHLWNAEPSAESLTFCCKNALYFELFGSQSSRKAMKGAFRLVVSLRHLRIVAGQKGWGLRSSSTPVHTKWTQNYSKSKLGTLIIEIYITVPPPKVARPNKRDPTVNPTEVTSNQWGKAASLPTFMLIGSQERLCSCPASWRKPT